MDEIIARAIRGQATAQEVVQLDAWRAESSENECHYQQVGWVLDALRGIALREQSPVPRAAELIERMRLQRLRGAGPSRSWPRTWLPWSLAAAASVLLAIQFATRVQPLTTAAAGESAQPTEIVTGEGELATVRMQDGSVVRLAPRSRLRLLATRHERDVWLEGHAFFAVAKDPSRPFRVRTSEGDLVVLGTRFDVRTEPRGLRVAVIEGRVALFARGERTEVASGEASGVRDGFALPTLRIDNVDDITKWMRRFLAFQSTELRTVAMEIERVYGKRVVLTDPSLARETVTATFTDESLAQVVRVVCTVVGVQCAVTDSLVTISR